MRKIFSVLALTGLVMNVPAFADDMKLPELKRQPAPQAVLDEHLDALNKCDWNRIMAQFPDDVEFMLPNGAGHHRTVINANGVSDAPAERSEPVTHPFRAHHHPGCCDRAQSIELADCRDHSRDRTPATEEDRTGRNGTAASAASLA